MLRRHMATKKKDMPKDLDSESSPLDDDIVDGISAAAVKGADVIADLEPESRRF